MRGLAIYYHSVRFLNSFFRVDEAPANTLRKIPLGEQPRHLRIALQLLSSAVFIFLDLLINLLTVNLDLSGRVNPNFYLLLMSCKKNDSRCIE